jgi:hypothetical protein
MPYNPSPVPADASGVASGTNANAVVTLAARTDGQGWAIDGFAWSYSGDPTGGRVTLAAGAVTFLDLDVTAKGPGVVSFNRPLRTPANTALTATLSAGGSGVVGKLNLLAPRPD